MSKELSRTAIISFSRRLRYIYKSEQHVQSFELIPIYHNFIPGFLNLISNFLELTPDSFGWISAPADCVLDSVKEEPIFLNYIPVCHFWVTYFL